jgi:hypothetical protein
VRRWSHESRNTPMARCETGRRSHLEALQGLHATYNAGRAPTLCRLCPDGAHRACKVSGMIRQRSLLRSKPPLMVVEALGMTLMHSGRLRDGVLTKWNSRFQRLYLALWSKVLAGTITELSGVVFSSSQWSNQNQRLADECNAQSICSVSLRWRSFK